VERAIGYTRQSFWPLREFTDLHDVNRQARQWLSEVANQRQHRETRQRPMDRFQPAALKPLPVIPYDYRDRAELLVIACRRRWSRSNGFCPSLRKRRILGSSGTSLPRRCNRSWMPLTHLSGTASDGIRDRAMLHLCFAGGLRVSELVGLRIEDMMLQPQASVLIHGKSRKERCLPLWKETASAIRAWLSVRGEVRVPELFPNARCHDSRRLRVHPA
jgi:integrase